MPAPIYTTATAGAVALTAATAKSVLGVRAHANSALLLKKVRYAFDGTSATAVPVLVEVCYATFASNAPGTNSTSVTPAQVAGRTTTAGFTAAKNWTTEPTVLTVLDEILVTPYSGTVFYDFPLGDEYDTALNEGFVLRCTAPAGVNVRSTFTVSRA